MPGQTNLDEVLKSLTISCDDIEYGFASVKHQGIASSQEIIGTFLESEGLTIIAKKQYLEEHSIQYEGPFAKLTVEVQTSLDLKGLTAVLSQKLAENNLSANVVAAYFHDHIFVRFEMKTRATALLLQLKEEETPR